MKKTQLNFYLDMLYITFLCFGFLVFEDGFEFSNIGVIAFGVMVVIKHLFKISPAHMRPNNKNQAEKYYPWIFIILLFVTTWMLGRERVSILLDHPLMLIFIWIAWFLSGLKTISQSEESFTQKMKLNDKEQIK